MADKQYKILLIEDEEMLANMYQTKFKNEGFDIAVALNGEDGLDQAKKVNPDLILLDIIMPKLDGFSVLRLMRQEDALKNTPVILLTNLGQEEDVKKGNDLGASGYLVKANLTPAEVVAKVKETLKI